MTGKQIKELRTKRGMSLADLANALENTSYEKSPSRMYLWDVEKGRRNVTSALEAAIKELFGNEVANEQRLTFEITIHDKDRLTIHCPEMQCEHPSSRESLPKDIAELIRQYEWRNET